MGRPSLGRSERLLTVRCSAEEYDRIQANARVAKMDMAGFVRERALAPVRTANLIDEEYTVMSPLEADEGEG